jgi:hypothetical protein
VTFYAFSSLKNDVNVHSKTNKQKNLYFLLVSSRPMTKIAGSGAGSGSVSHRYGSAPKCHGSATLKPTFRLIRSVRAASLNNSKNATKTMLTSVCMIGERNEDFDLSEVSAFSGARGRFGVSCGPPCILPTAAFRGRIPNFSFRLSGSRAVNDVKAILYYSL